MKRLEWKELAELLGIAAIVVSLVFLIIEVRENSLAIEQQAAVDRANAITMPFFESELPSILAKVSSVDGDFGLPEKFVERYDLTQEEAILWERHLWYVWEVIEASFITEGASEKIERQIRLLLVAPDNALYVQNAIKYQFDNSFAAYVLELQENQEEFLRTLDVPGKLAVNTDPSAERNREQSSAKRLAEMWIDSWNVGRPYSIPLAESFVHSSPLGRLEGRENYLEKVVPMAKETITSITALETFVARNDAVVLYELQTPSGSTRQACDWVLTDGNEIREVRSFYDASAIADRRY